MTTEILHTAKGQLSAPPARPQQALTADGAVSVETYCTTLDATSATVAATLAAGTIKGQLKKITGIDKTKGSPTVTCGVMVGGNTLTFAASGDSALLQWTGTEWVPIELSGAALSAV